MDTLQKQWKILREQFTQEHRAQKMYEPSGTENVPLDTSKRPRKTWYLYESLLFLAPQVAYRKTSSNFMRKKTMSVIEQSAQSTLQFISESPSQSPLQSASVILPNRILPHELSLSAQSPEYYSDDSNSATFPAEKQASSTSSISSVDQSKPVTIAKRNLITPPLDPFAIKKTKDVRKKLLTKMIGDIIKASYKTNNESLVKIFTTY